LFSSNILIRLFGSFGSSSAKAGLKIQPLFARKFILPIFPQIGEEVLQKGKRCDIINRLTKISTRILRRRIK
jgi:hypothetical protein